MRNEMSNSVLAEIKNHVSREGYAPLVGDDTPDFAGAVVAVNGGGCLVVHAYGRAADFYARVGGSGEWSYRHSYWAPRRPHDAVRYLRHGLRVI